MSLTWREVKYQPERSKTYLGSPSILRLPDGALLASHDYFGLPNCPRNHEDEESLTSIYRSEDDGLTWVNITHIMNCYWSSLFAHRGSVYILGVSQQYGLHRHPPQRRRRLHLDASGRRTQRSALPRRALPPSAELSLRARARA